MYEKFYGLSERPFELGSDLRFLFLPPAHREALSNLEYAIASRKGVTVLTGEVGTGKTTLVCAAIAKANSNVQCVHLANPRLTRDEFFEYLVRGFGIDLPRSASKVECLAALEQRLSDRLDNGQYSALIVDESQTISDDLLEEIRLLTNIDRLGERLMSIVLVGQPEFAERLNATALRHLKQRVALRCDLRALTLQETAAYIASRVKVAGGNAAFVFTREAVQFIHEVAGGIPRVISVLCDNALVTGFAVNERPVGSRLVKEVCRDFNLEYRASSVTAAEDVRGPAPLPLHSVELQRSPNENSAAGSEPPREKGRLFSAFSSRRSLGK